MSIENLDVTEFAFPFHRNGNFEQNGLTVKDMFALQAMIMLGKERLTGIKDSLEVLREGSEKELLAMEIDNDRNAKFLFAIECYDIASEFCKAREASH